jgi:hypothetical protein
MTGFSTVYTYSESPPFIPSDACRVIFSWLKLISFKDELRRMQARQVSLKAIVNSTYNSMTAVTTTKKSQRRRRLKKQLA